MHELIKKAIEAKAVVKFESYFKYEFYFTGRIAIEGKVYSITARKGGSADAIYNLEIDPTSEDTLSERFQAITLYLDKQEVADWDNF